MKVGIVGGGITGLAAAHELSKRGCEVAVYERDSLLGGLAGSFEIQGEYLEKFYHNISDLDAAMIQLAKEVGPAEDLHWKNSKFGFYYVNKIYRFDSPLDILRFKPLNLLERLRMGLGVFKIQSVKDWRVLDAASAKEFIVRAMGEKAYRVVWEPLLKNRFGAEHYEGISASWLWAKINSPEKSKSTAVQKKVGHYRGGFERLFRRLAESVIQKGGRVLSKTPVVRIESREGRVHGLTTAKGYEPFDRVIATVPLPIFLELTPELPVAYRENLEQFKYLGVACLVLVLKQSLTHNYWVNVNDPEFPFVGIIEHTNLDWRETIHGKHVVYIPKYTDPSSTYYRSSKEELLETYFPFLKRIFPAFEKNWISEMYLWKEKYAQPLTTVGYGGRIPPLQTPLQNLYLATMAQIYPEDRGMNNGVRLAKELVDFLVRPHPVSPPPLKLASQGPARLVPG